MAMLHDNEDYRRMLWIEAAKELLKFFSAEDTREMADLILAGYDKTFPKEEEKHG